MGGQTPKRLFFHAKSFLCPDNLTSTVYLVWKWGVARVVVLQRVQTKPCET